jgi:hypothetical protein
MTIATQATLAALLAKVISAPATEAKQDTGNTSLASIATQTNGLATAAAQTSGNTKLDTLHTDLTAALTTQNRALTVSATLSALNATADGTNDVAGYSSVRVQITGTYSGGLGFQISDDGTNWRTRTLAASDGTGVTGGPPATGTGAYFGDIGGRYFRVLMSSYTSGSAVITLVYNTGPSTGATTLTAGTSLVGSVLIGSTTVNAFSTVSTASTNATSVSGSVRNLTELTVSNPTATAAYLKLYNKATAPTVGTDVPVATYRVAATGSAGDTITPYLGVNGKRFSTGLAWALTGAAATTDTTNAVAGVIVSGTYF